MVQFVKAIVEEAPLKGFDVLWANARERKVRMCEQDRSGDVRTNNSRVSWHVLVWVNARFRLHLRSPGAACRRPSGVIRPSAPLPSVAARAVRRQTRNKLFGSTRALPASVMCLESLHVCTF